MRHTDPKLNPALALRTIVTNALSLQTGTFVLALTISPGEREGTDTHGEYIIIKAPTLGTELEVANAVFLELFDIVLYHTPDGFFQPCPAFGYHSKCFDQLHVFSSR